MVFEDGVPLYGLISTDSPPRTASLALASLDHHWGRRCLERVGLALAERGSLRPSAWFVGCGSGASLPLRRDALAPVLSNRPLWWQLIQECLHSVARPERFRDPPHRETWSRLVAICDTSHTELRKVSCPAPAPPQSLRNTAPMKAAFTCQRVGHSSCCSFSRRDNRRVGSRKGSEFEHLYGVCGRRR